MLSISFLLYEDFFNKYFKKVFVEINKDVEYDFERDSLIITFTEEEIEDILNRYDDEIKNSMDHFTNSLTDYIYSREFQEHHYDYYAHSVKKMHNLYEGEIEDPIVKEINKPKIKSIGIFGKKRRKHT